MIGGHVVYGQDSTHPPLVYKAPDKALFKTFVSPDKTFEAVFTGDPTVKNIETNDFNVTTLETYREGSHSTIVVYKYNSLMDKNRPAVYERVRQNLLKTPKTSIESEIELKNGEIEGKEFNVLTDYFFKRLRVFVKEKMVYLVSCDVTNWHILSTYYKKDKVIEFMTESDRFLNSFKIK